jgi:hypothetical protein
MGGVINGQSVSAEVTNPAFIEKNANDAMPFKLDMIDTDPVSGPSLINHQRNTNSIMSFIGSVANGIYNLLPTWLTSNRGLSTDNLFQRISAIDTAFHPTTGHYHTGAAGDGPQVSGLSLSNVNNAGFVQQGVDIVGVTGSSSIVTTQFTGYTPSTASTVEGVVVNAPYNKIFIRNAVTDDQYEDATGNEVYARLTESAGVWTLSYYSEIVGVETVYSFSVSSDVRFYYQVLSKVISSTAPVYNQMFFVPSANATADIITATTAVQGKTQLSTASTDVSASASNAGTTNATVANANHTHRGVSSLSVTSPLYGAVTLIAGPNINVVQSGQNITFSMAGFTAIQETPTGLVNGTNDTFTFSDVAISMASVSVYIDGLQSFGTYSFTQGITNSTITFSAGNIPQVGQSIAVQFYTSNIPIVPPPSNAGALVITGSLGTPSSISSAGGLTVSNTNQRMYQFINSTGGAQIITATPQISASTVIGAELIIRGTSNTNYPIFNDGNGLDLNGSIALQAGNQIYLVWDGSNWSEVSRR